MDTTLSSSATAVVVGASGGLGRAWVAQRLASGRFGTVLALSRTPSGAHATLPGAQPVAGATRLVEGHIDLQEPSSIAQAAAMAGTLPPIREVFVASGLLHADDGLAPEKSMRALDAAQLQRLFEVNAIGPALVARHFMPLMPREGRVVFAALSARVGSITDNRLGGWYGYRASKAALNQFIRTLAIEWSRTAKGSVCVGLHPGTVDTALSAPFQANVAQDRLFTPQQSVAALDAVLASLGAADTGQVYAWDGQPVPA
jgi:NAD(P)-dependent dehydrogenase (short-subunit alcohol dehydrogenase family)